MEINDPDWLLALAYAGRNAAKLRVLLAFDKALGRLVATTREPVIAQMKLAWWRENLMTDAASVQKGEPVLQAVHQLGLAACAVEMVNGWEAVLGELPLDSAALEGFASGRGGGLFGAAMRVYGLTPTPQSLYAGRSWALADFAFHCSDAETSARALTMTAAPVETKDLPRPLAILAVLAQSDIARGPQRRWRPGSPIRILRAFACALTGR